MTDGGEQPAPLRVAGDDGRAAVAACQQPIA